MTLRRILASSFDDSQQFLLPRRRLSSHEKKLRHIITKQFMNLINKDDIY